jgi:hypothetical protein
VTVGVDRNPGSAVAAEIKRSDQRTRAWTLLLIDAASRNGITPLSKLRFHRVAYLANGMSRVLGIRAADERIVKHRRGPFYPDLQWHLDRLAGQGLIRMRGVRHFSDPDGSWMDAEYSMLPRGVEVVETLCQLDERRQLAAFHLEIVRAFAAQDDDLLDEIALSDVTYADPKWATNAVINFSRRHDNLSAQLAESFANLAPDPRALTMHDKIVLYVEYIERKAIGAGA